MVRVLALSGSLRAASLNSAALQAARSVAPDDLDIMIYGGMDTLPHFNPDIEGDINPPSVMELRALVAAADGVLIACPEYAHGVPGAFKNLLDWLVGSVDFPGKPVALINMSARSFHAQAALKEILRTMSARLINEADMTLSVPSRSYGGGDIADHAELSGVLRHGLYTFARAIRVSKGN